MRALVVVVVGGDGVALVSASNVAVGPCPFVAQRGEREGGCVYSPGLSCLMRVLVVVVVSGDGVALVSAGDVAVRPCLFVAQRGKGRVGVFTHLGCLPWALVVVVDGGGGVSALAFVSPGDMAVVPCLFGAQRGTRGGCVGWVYSPGFV